MSEAGQILDATVPAPVPNTTDKPVGEGTTDGTQALSNKDDKVSSRLEVLIRREQAALHAERAAKQREQELEAKLAQIREFDGAKANSKKALDMLGLNYDELTQSMLKDGEIPPSVEIKRLREELETYKTSQKSKEDEALDAQKKTAQAQEQTAISNFKGEINTYLKDNAARYELIQFEDNQDLVFDVVDEHYNRTMNSETGVGKVLSIAEAADKVEQFLEKKYEKSRDLSKVKTLWNAIPKTQQVSFMAKAAPKPVQTPKTLTNTLTATPTKPRTAPLSDQERVQKAIAYARSLRPGL